MPQASIYVDTVLQRLRDSQGVTVSRATARQVMTAAQRALNMKRKLVLATATIVTNKQQVFYPIRPLIPTALDVQAVRELNRDLIRVDWHQFWYYSRNWHREMGDRYNLFSMVGKDLMILFPGKPRASTVDVVYVVETANLEENTVMEVPDEAIPLVMDLTHAILTIAGRNFGPLKPILDVLAARIKVL